MTRRRGRVAFHATITVNTPIQSSLTRSGDRLFLDPVSFSRSNSLSHSLLNLNIAPLFSVSLFPLILRRPSATFLSGFTAELLLLLLARSAALHSSLNFPAAIALRPFVRPSVRPTADRSFRQPFGRRYRTALLYRVRPRFFDPLLNARLQKSEYGTR